ncbi:MAG: LamG domain-containing protein [Phycisphaeraceae bacterium]
MFARCMLATATVLSIHMWFSGSAAAQSQEEDPSAAADIAAWAQIKQANGPEGRPLPLTGSWVNNGMFGPRETIEMIEEGHHLLPTLAGGPGFLARYAYVLENQGFLNEKLPNYMDEILPVVEYSREHRLPISLGGGNWATGPVRMEYDYNRAPEKNRKTFTPEQSVRLMIEQDGEVTSGSWKMSSPFSPDERWVEYAKWWMDNPAMRTIRETYPDPPMVVWLNNNEAGEIGTKHLDRSIRFQREYGDQDLDNDDKQRILHEAYDKKYKVLFDAARESLSEPAWSNNSVFVAYNAWPRSVKGRTWERNHPSEWKRYNGTMPEFYLNDWQIYRGKTDYNYWSPQTESLRIQSSQDVIFDLDPDHYFASIVWDGGQPAARRSAINSMATGMYGSGPQQRWDIPRYEGMVQFGLWAMRPRVMREFRYPVSQHDAYDKAAFMAVVRSVDRPWNHDVLKEFWRFGELVQSDEFEPKDDRVAEELQFYSRVTPLLPVDVNPDRHTQWPRIWELKAGKSDPTKLRVLALAHKLGEAPDRRWLIYAHAPLGGVTGPKVTLPDYDKQVELPQVAKSGSFFLVHEGEDVAKTIIPGGPAELELKVGSRFAGTGEQVDVEASVAFAPEGGFTSFDWSLGDGKSHQTDRLGKFDTKVTEQGLQMIRVTGTTADGEKVVADAPVFVGGEPDEAVVYDLELSDASGWEGVWQGVGPDQREMLTYRMVPNPGRAPDIPLHGGTFVQDEDLGRRVLELSHDDEGLWGDRSDLTCGHPEGHPNVTVSLRFKAESLDATQPLYVQGGTGKGFNIYLHDGQLYAGSMSGKREWGEHGGEAMGKGAWISTDRVEAGQWHHVSLVLEGATKSVQPDKLSLYIDGEKVGSAPGVRVPNHHAAPRIGTVLNTTLHNGDNISGVSFRGRIADFQQMNDARPPR